MQIEMATILGSFMAMQRWTERDNISYGMRKEKNLERKSYVKKLLLKDKKLL